MKAVNIRWDTDGDVALFNELPSSIEIPNELEYDEERISDWLTEQSGFCHKGFDLINEVINGRK